MSVDKQVFVNPYQFAPLPELIPRREPPWHHGVPDGTSQLHSGSIRVRWVLESPLLLPATHQDGDSLELPGSSVKGAVRAVHEALFKGCLRVVDPEYLPAYREPAKAIDGWYLAQVVTTTRGGIPLEVDVCQEPDWIDGPGLFRAYRAAGRKVPPTSGDILDVDGDSMRSDLGRFEITTVKGVANIHRVRTTIAEDQAEGSSVVDAARSESTSTAGGPVAVPGAGPSPVPGVAAGIDSSGKATQTKDIQAEVDGDCLTMRSPVGSRILLVTDTSVRRVRQRNGDRGRALWALGTVAGDILRVTGDAQKNFRFACQNADDLRRVKHADPKIPGVDSTQGWESGARHADVQWWDSNEGQAVGPRRVIARRALTTGLLFPGDVVWVQVGADGDDDVVTGIKLSQIWRSVGATKLGRRLPQADLPTCEEPSQLCLSCEIFGSVAPKDDDSERAQQLSYAGHVRFGTARVVGDVKPEGGIDLAPLGAPHPGAGMFYLEDRPLRNLGPRTADLPSHWGADADQGSARMLRGRKFYWHSNPERQRQHIEAEVPGSVSARYVRRPKQQDSKQRRTLVPEATTFEQTITVDAIRLDALHSLLATLDLKRVMGPKGDWVHHLGGGKPFGLGTVRLTIISTDLKPHDARYRTSRSTSEGDPEPFPPDSAAINAHADPAAVEVMARLLDVKGLKGWENYVSYPTVEPWRRFGREEFDQSFRFFTQNSGEQLSAGRRSWKPLPTIPTDRNLPFYPMLRGDQ